MPNKTEHHDPVVTVAQMVAAEQRLFDQGVSVDALMQIAGEGAARLIWRIGGKTPTLILCGPGNNGGDGYVIAEFLRRHDVPVTVTQSAPPKTDAAQNARNKYKGDLVSLENAKPASQFVDCLFGSGLSRAVETELWAHFTRLFAGSARRFAVDLPSGIDADRAMPLNDVRRFDYTIALGAWKYAHLLQPTAELMGQISLINIGVDLANHLVNRLKKPNIAAPDASSHKYSRGLVVILAGAMQGAAILAAIAAQASGAGYVKILSLDTAPASLPVDIVWQECANLSEISAALDDKRIAACLVGPGLGRDEQAKHLFDAAINCKASLVLDADGLYCVSEKIVGALHKNGRAAILTPHHGEFMHLVESLDISDQIENCMNKVDAAQYLARLLDISLIYKGNDSVLVSRSGETIIADRNNPWLSVAGSGDVLAGALAARLANISDPTQAMCEAQYLQNRAAQLAGPSFSAARLAQHLSIALGHCL